MPKPRSEEVKEYAQLATGPLVLPFWIHSQQVALPDSHHPLKATNSGSLSIIPGCATSQHVHNKYFCSEWMRLDQNGAYMFCAQVKVIRKDYPEEMMLTASAYV